MYALFIVYCLCRLIVSRKRAQGNSRANTVNCWRTVAARYRDTSECSWRHATNAPVVMMTSSSSSLCRRHTDLHSPASYAPSSLSAFLQSSTSTDYGRHHYQAISNDYLPPRVTSVSAGLHGDATTHHVHQQQVQRSPSFAIHELLGLHGPMMPVACPGSTPVMFDCSAGAGAGYTAAVTGSSYRQQTQFFPATYHSSAPAPPSTPLSMSDIEPPPVQPPPPPALLPAPPSCHRASTSSWPPTTSPTSRVSELTTAHAHRPTTYRDAYDVLQRNFKPDVTRAFAAVRSVSHKYVTHYRTYRDILIDARTAY